MCYNTGGSTGSSNGLRKYLILFVDGGPRWVFTTHMPVDESQYSRVRIPLAEAEQLKALAAMNDRPYGAEVMRGIKAYIVVNLPAIEAYLSKHRASLKARSKIPKRN